MTPEAHLEQMYPHVQWREPLPASTFDHSAKGLACRFCIAIRGIRGSELGNMPQTRAEFDAHMKEHINK